MRSLTALSAAALLLVAGTAYGQEPADAPPEAAADPATDDPSAPDTAETSPEPASAPEPRAEEPASPPIDEPKPAPKVVRPPTVPTPLPDNVVPGRATRVEILKDENGFKLLVDGRDFMIRGMNWDYFPIGTNYSYNFWGQPDAFIKKALEREFGLMREMGVNAVRMYDSVPPRWITYIYENYGILTMVNNTVGRYGHTIDGTYVASVDYSDPKHRAVIKKDALASFARYKDTPGVLLYLLGNENNYGLVWQSFEIENLPEGEQHRAKAEHLYSLFGDIIDTYKALNPDHIVSIANGELQYLDLIAEHCGNMDIMGSNIYRGISSGDLFERVKNELDMPFVYTEFGADAYNAREEREDAYNQAVWLKGLWREIYEQAYGMGRVGNAVGGFTFQWSDGWWKYGQTQNLDIHDTTASWTNGGYDYDFMPDKFNMNEEWWGICGKGPTDSQGHYPLYPRTAYYMLQKAYEYDPYAPDADLESLRAFFGSVRISDYTPKFAVASLDGRTSALERLRVNTLRLETGFFVSGNSDVDDLGKDGLEFDHMESVYFGFEANPTSTIRADVSFNFVANAPRNRINDIFYENRIDTVDIAGSDGETKRVTTGDRLQLHRASFTWDHSWFQVEGYHRKGHYHWGYEGDFWGLYPEANYQESVDLYNANAPSGVVVSGKQTFDGLKLAFGPEIYWGANPTAIAKLHKKSGAFEFSVMHQEDLGRQTSTTSSGQGFSPVTRRTALMVGLRSGALTLQVGGLWSGSERVGDEFRRAEDDTSGRTYLDSGYYVLEDKVIPADTLGGKAKLTWSGGRFNAVLQGGYQGIVADAGADARVDYTGWTLKPSGRGNQIYANAGATYQLGDFQIGPNVLYQKPLVDPLPLIADFYSQDTNTFYSGTVPRNVLDDPFAVLDNRETIGFEFMLTYDPTPETWLWQWDNKLREDAGFASTLDFVYRIQPTSRDSNLFISEGGDVLPFNAAPEASDEWLVNARVMMNPTRGLRMITMLYTGQNLANGLSNRKLMRFGGSVETHWRTLIWNNIVKVNDWGPYDFHRDFDLSFPLQLTSDFSYGVSIPAIGGFDSRFGLLVQFRYLDENSPMELNLPEPGQPYAYEYEVGTYFRISM